MDLSLQNKIVLITGASGGIGQAAAKLFAEEGAQVVIGYHRDETGALETAAMVKKAGCKSWLCQFDAGNAESVKKAFAGLKEKIPELNSLVICAGLNIITPFAELEAEEWNRVINVNLNGAFYVLKAALPLFAKEASVVTVASVAAHTGAPHHAHYAAAKAGLVNLSKSAARALAPGVRVNCVTPGITLTPMGQETARALPPDYAQKKLLSQRFAAPQEIARCIVFLASPAAGFIYGATIDINGGRELR
jgi:3-oxoacyl-[acyl-carrier protein] reductase